MKKILSGFEWVYLFIRAIITCILLISAFSYLSKSLKENICASSNSVESSIQFHSEINNNSFNKGQTANPNFSIINIYSLKKSNHSFEPQNGYVSGYPNLTLKTLSNTLLESCIQLGKDCKLYKTLKIGLIPGKILIVGY
jgi:hypothetical protein